MRWTIEREVVVYNGLIPASFFPARWPGSILTSPPRGFWRLKPAKAGRLRLKPPQDVGNRSFQGFRTILGRKTLLECPAEAGTTHKRSFVCFWNHGLDFKAHNHLPTLRIWTLITILWTLKPKSSVFWRSPFSKMALNALQCMLLTWEWDIFYIPFILASRYPHLNAQAHI